MPDVPASSDTGSTEVGVKVVPQTDGFVTAVRFYKGAGNTGTHTGHLWSSDGDLLATGTFAGETATRLADAGLPVRRPGRRGQHVRGLVHRTERALRG